MFFAHIRWEKSPNSRQKFEPQQGQVRALFAAMFGDCTKNEVTRTLRTIDWLPRHRGGHIAIATVNGVDRPWKPSHGTSTGSPRI